MNFPLVRFVAIALLALPLTQVSQAAAIVDSFTLDSISVNSSAPPIPISDSQTLTVLGQTATRDFSVGTSAPSGVAQGQIFQGTFDFAALPSTGSLGNLAYSGLNVDLTSTPILRIDFDSQPSHGVAWA